MQGYNDSNMKTRESPDQNAKVDFRLPYKFLYSSKQKSETNGEKIYKKNIKINKKNAKKYNPPPKKYPPSQIKLLHSDKYFEA